MSAEDVSSLIANAIAAARARGVDHDGYWEAIYPLHEADVDAVWNACVPLARDPDARLRVLVPDVLRYLGRRPQPRLTETVALFDEMLHTDDDARVIAAIGNAFVDIPHPAAVDLMVPFARHADENVRQAVVAALLGHREQRAVDTLIVLSRDPVVSVRDWATFGLGSQLGEPSDESFFDSEPLRAALVARLEDEDEETRLDAAEGLALRKDERALSTIERALAADIVSPIAIDAAYAMASPKLAPALERIAARGEIDGGHCSVEEAIAACRGR